MSLEIKEFIGEVGQLGDMLQKVRDFEKISAFGLPFYNRLFSAALYGRGVYVCADLIAARAAYEALSDLCECVLLPAKDDVLSYRKSQSGESAAVRLRAMGALVSGSAQMIVTTAEALCQLYPDRKAFALHTVQIERGKTADVYDLVAKLTLAGYQRETQVGAPGQFSLRGDILDVWAVGDSVGFRIEFFGDEVESVRRFDVAEQVSLSEEDSVTVYPNTEIFMDESQAAAVCEKIRKQIKNYAHSDESGARAISLCSELIGRISAGDRDRALNVVMPLTQHVGFMTFFQPSAVFYDDAKSVFDAVSVTFSEHSSRFKTLFTRGEVLAFSADQLIPQHRVFLPDSAARKTAMVAFHKLTGQNRLFAPDAVYNFNEIPLPDYSKDYLSLAEAVGNWALNGFSVTLFADDAVLHQNLCDLLTDHNIGYGFYKAGEPLQPGTVYIVNQKLGHGAVFFDAKSVLIGTQDLTRKRAKKQLKRSKKDVFVEPEVGDYVVHNVHGIGLCEAITKLEMGGVSRDYAVIRYAGGDKLYVPIENLDSLSKLVSGQEQPHLSKIGGQDFARVKERVKKSVKAMAINLLALYAERNQSNGHVYSEDDALLDEFSAEFPYSETDDQLTAVAEGLLDLKTGKIMDRLLCGDVGYGKTEVALRLAFKVIVEGKQVAFLSPTTILARQHYQTSLARMEKFGVRIASLTRFDSAESIKQTLKKLQDGEVDLVCGTHRLLSKDVMFRDLGMLVLDEEQRFGVADKEKIKLLKNNVNVLSLSATPIPRTLHMSMVGIRDVSVLDTPPADRIPVQTYVAEYGESLVFDAILREYNRGGQTFIVFNRVSEIDSFAASVQRLVPDLKVSVGHGQMPEGALERVIASFVGGESDVLVASTIIENGIDMPRANTLIVVDADRLGLSQLYQLRGRVGRSNRLAYAYFTFDGRKTLSETAYKRLDAITQFTEFGSGFKIAMRDLEIRGAGNILGREQHGHIEKVGYDMYCKLLSQAVEELRGYSGATIEPREIKVLTDFNAFIPESYVTDNAWRVRLYTKIARLSSDADRVKLTADLSEIYGKVPSSVSNLLTVGLVKNLALLVGATGVSLKKSGSALTFSRVLDIADDVARAVNRFSGASVSATLPGIVFSGAEGARTLVKFLLSVSKKSV